MGSRFRHRLIDPFVIPIVVIAITWFGLMTIGKTFLAAFEGGEVDRIDRPELWIGVGIVVGIIALMGFLATRPRGTTGPLEKPVAIGSRPFFEEPLPPVDSRARTGTPGTAADITDGYTLYAQSGALAVVHGVLPGGSDYGKRFAGFLYAEGLAGASKELWIPIEAVTAVYPESRSAFLAIKGDETEHFGWNIPPETVRRGPSRIPAHTVEEQGQTAPKPR
jgi:hypothetical protein